MRAALSKSAVALRLTARPILDIALQYRSTPADLSPERLRNSFADAGALPPLAVTGARSVSPPLRLGEFTLPKHEFITLAPTQLLGVTQSYTCKLEEISDFRNQMRVQFWRDFLGNSPSIPPVLYGLHEPRPSLKDDEAGSILYHRANAGDG